MKGGNIPDQAHSVAPAVDFASFRLYRIGVPVQSGEHTWTSQMT